jgi:hypothetical protein
MNHEEGTVNVVDSSWQEKTELPTDVPYSAFIVGRKVTYVKTVRKGGGAGRC